MSFYDLGFELEKNKSVLLKKMNEQKVTIYCNKQKDERQKLAK